MKKIISFLLIVTILSAMLPLSALADVDSGYCGKNTTWTFNPSSGTLTISGQGKTDGYIWHSMIMDRPWNAYLEDIVSVVVENGVTHIGDGAFYYFENLKNVVIAESVCSIGDSTFSSCENLTSITLPYSVTHIGSGAFSCCTNLSEISLPNSLTSIGKNAFRECTSLTKIALPDSVESIEYWAFYDCINLKDVTVSKNLSNFGSNVFWNCENIIYNKYENGIYLGTQSNDYSLLISIEDKTVSEFNIHPETTVIGAQVFYNCANLTSVNMPDGLIGIGSSAFSECSNLKNIDLPSNLVYLGANAFDSCSNLEGTITIPSGITEIQDGTFANCANLSKIIIPQSVVIVDCNFSGCEKLEYNQYDNGLYLGNENNPYSALITTVSEEITSCIIHPDVNAIGHFAFWHSNITSITIPDKITTLSVSIYDCPYLTTVILPKNLKSFSGGFCECFALKDIVIPKSVEYLDAYNMFDSCINLTDIYCEAESQPEGWDEHWLNDEYCPSHDESIVHWGYTPKIGDPNNDGALTATDYLMLKKIVFGSLSTESLKDTQSSFERCDITGDGKITAADYFKLKKIIMS